jgi:hypothetical protein
MTKSTRGWRKRKSMSDDVSNEEADVVEFVRVPSPTARLAAAIDAVRVFGNDDDREKAAAALMRIAAKAMLRRK